MNKKNIISDYDLQMAENQLAQTKAQLAQAEAQLVNAKNNLSYTSVTSPSDGIVGSIPYRVGSLVKPLRGHPADYCCRYLRNVRLLLHDRKTTPVTDTRRR